MNLPPEVVWPMIEKIVADLQGRKGLGDEWDQIDPETQQEIKGTWAGIVMYP